MSQANSLFGPMFVVVSVIVAAVFVAVIVITIINTRKATRNGLNPLTLQTDLAAKVMNSDLLSASETKAERLAELDALRDTGAISPDEHAAARAAILRE